MKVLLTWMAKKWNDTGLPFVDRIKQRKEEKKRKTSGEWWENHENKDNRTGICKGFGRDF